jgi:hypothetical protein
VTFSIRYSLFPISYFLFPISYFLFPISYFLKVGAEVFDELGGVEGFGEEFKVVAALAGAGEDFYRGSLTAEEDDAGVGGELADGDGGFYAVDVGHQDVGKDELWVDVAGGVDGFLATVGGLSDEAAAIEDLADGVGDKGFVVDHENAGQGVSVRQLAVWQCGGLDEAFQRLVG